MATRKNYLERIQQARGNIPCSNFEKSKKIKDLSGQVFGKLTVIKYVGLNYKRAAVWECRCECGQITSAETTSLKTGVRKSCGCLMREINSSTEQITKHVKSSNASGLVMIYNHYRKAAKKRNLSFNLGIEQFSEIIESQCHYCGRSHTNTKKMTHNREFKYNGIDRIDNEIGYETDNVLPCCIVCNRMKMDMGLSEFASYISCLVKHTKTWIKNLQY